MKTPVLKSEKDVWSIETDFETCKDYNVAKNRTARQYQIFQKTFNKIPKHQLQIDK